MQSTFNSWQALGGLLSLIGVGAGLWAVKRHASRVWHSGRVKSGAVVQGGAVSLHQRSLVTVAVLEAFFETPSGVNGFNWEEVAGWIRRDGVEKSETLKLQLAQWILAGPAVDVQRRMDVAWLAVMASKMLKDSPDPMPAGVLLSLVLRADRPCLKGDVLSALCGPLTGYRSLCSGVISQQGVDEHARDEMAMRIAQVILGDLMAALGTFAARQMAKWTLEDVHAVCLAAHYAYSRKKGVMEVAGVGSGESLKQDHDRFWLNVGRKLIDCASQSNRALVIDWVESVSRQACGDLPMPAASVDKQNSAASKEVATYFPMPESQVRKQAAVDLTARFPWAEGLVSRLFSEIEGRAKCGSPQLGMIPKLLIAPAGGGKTDFVRRFSRCLGVPTLVVTPGVRSDFDLQSFMDDCKITNPMIVIDGIDRLCESAHEWRDVHAQVSWLTAALDESRQVGLTDGGIRGVRSKYAEVIWVMTAQSVESIPDALLSRMQSMKLPQPTQAHILDVARNRLADIASMWRVPAESLPAAEVLDLHLKGKAGLLEQVCSAVDASALHWGGVRLHVQSALQTDRYFSAQEGKSSAHSVRQGDKDE